MRESALQVPGLAVLVSVCGPAEAVVVQLLAGFEACPSRQAGRVPYHWWPAGRVCAALSDVCNMW